MPLVLKEPSPASFSFLFSNNDSEWKLNCDDPSLNPTAAEGKHADH